MMKSLIGLIAVLLFPGVVNAATQGNSCTPAFVLDANLNCRNMQSDIVLVQGAFETTLSTAGMASPNRVYFSSNVVIEGDLEVKSTRQRAIYLPAGGLNISAAEQVMEARKIRTSTITMVGSAMFWENEAGVVTSTMTGTELKISSITATGSIDATSVSGKIRTTAGGAGAPAAADCDSVLEQGGMYLQTTPGRLHICDFNGVAGWRSVTLSP